MSYPAKILWGIVLVALAGGAIAAQFVSVPITGVEFTEHTTNAGELTSTVLVGQTFTAQHDNLSGVSVLFATYSGRPSAATVEFHLRPSIYATEDTRSVTVNTGTLNDNQLHTFSFEPIVDSADKQYFFFLTSPDGAEGKAVTVDLDTRDPYHQGSAYVVRGQGPNITHPGVLERSGKPTSDVGFALKYTVPVRQAVVQGSISQTRSFIAGWKENRTPYMYWVQSFLLAAAFLGIAAILQPTAYTWLLARMSSRTITFFGVTILVIVAALIRILYANELPITNDEGNYLYDAASIRHGIFAGGDGYVKSPLVVAWIALWQVIAGGSILASRLSSVLIGALTAIPLYFLAKHVWTSQLPESAWVPDQTQPEQKTISVGWGSRIGLLTVAVWALFGSAVVFNIYIHTQPVALFFAVGGLALLLISLRGNMRGQSWWIFVAGALVGLGVASRKSVLAIGLVPLLFILCEERSWNQRIRHLIIFGSGFIVVIALFLGVAYAAYGEQGAWEAIGYNSAEDGITSDPAEAEQVRAYSIRGMTPFFRESLPLILLSIIGLGFSLEYFLLTFITSFGKVPGAKTISRLGWLPAWAAFWWAYQFFFEYEGEAFMQWGIPLLWSAFAVVLVIAMIWPERINSNNTRWSTRRHLGAALTVPLWMLGLVVFYTNWIKFHANYISEFIVPLVLLAGFGTAAFLQRVRVRQWRSEWMPIFQNVLVGIFIVVVLWAGTVSNYITYLFEHTGTFHQGALVEAAAWARENIPADEPIFTGAAVVPYLSGHRISLDIAHPRWYAYEFTRKDTDRLNTFLPPAEEMVQAYRDAQWFLLDQQTSFSFLMEYNEIEAGLKTDWQAVKEIENGGNTLTFYRRIK
ncbi:MAG: hypothetical protein HYR90_02990 [Candidatus Andersenbacteria bacterium]|nr:hypothetical protein [Candidatus Andersenbacteria bacterium]MBI3250229.1 hypothetical protein [Candidatus Andersenbacteria bacterium]